MALEILDIHEVPAVHFGPLLEAESQAWFRDLHWDFTASAKLISTCLEEKRLSGYALCREGRIAGYCFFFLDGSKALIGDLFANSADDRTREATVLLDRSINVLMRTPGIRRIEAQLPHFRFEDLNIWFRSRSFDGYSRQFMAADLADPRDASQPAINPQPGRAPSGRGGEFRLDAWKRKYDRDAARLMFATYRHHIDAVVNDQYGSLEGASRLIDNITHLRGCGEFLEMASFVAVHLPTQRLAALVGTTAVRQGTAHIPQVAVATEFQRAGLGRMLLETAMRQLQKEGFKEVSLTVTCLNGGAVRLYERLGFRTFREFGAFTWKQP